MKTLILMVVFLCSSIYVVGQSKNFPVDALVDPKVQDRVITVGGAGSSIEGYSNESIQLAIDALSPGAGTVKLSKGVFAIKAPVRISSNIKLVGSGPETVLRRIDGYHSNFIIDADYGELKLTVADASGFSVGMSVQITDDLNSGCWDVSTAVITDIVGNTLYIDNYLIRDYDSEANGIVTNAGSCVAVLGERNVSISNLTIDGNGERNDLLDGCNGGGIAIIKSKNVLVEDVHVTNFNGEGITWQITEDVTIRNCEIDHCANMGMHPGTGSPNTVIEGTNSHHNKVGLFLCWRVQNSVVRGNKFHNNSDNGISTGHKDSDVLFENNHIYANGGDGIVLRNEDPKNSPHRNSFIGNIIEHNAGYGIHVLGNATDLIIRDNTFNSAEGGKKEAAIYVQKGAPPIKIVGNKVGGYLKDEFVYE
jgi:nitrous oxidase accessory protein NosD